MWKNKLVALLLGFIAYSSFGQYGNEWIDFSQTYYRFKIAEDDFYRITRDELQAAGFPIATVSPDRIQLFREGEEIAVRVVKNADFSFNYLEFYGQRKDGTSDSPLYINGGQPHTLYNLFTDSASYFLTVGSEDGKRMTFSNDQNTTGLTPESYHLEKDLQLFTSSYGNGFQFSFSSAFTLSIYDDAEGWTGTFLSKNGSLDYSFNLSNLENDIAPRFETVIVGGNSLDHNINFSAGPDATGLTSIANVQFSGYRDRFFANELPSTSIGAGGELTIRMLVEGFPSTADRASLSYLQVIYPQTISMLANENKEFNLDNVINRKAWLQIATTNAANTNIYNITDPANTVIMSAISSASQIDVVVPDVSVGSKLIAVTTPQSVGDIEFVTLPNYDLSSVDYLIVTHSQLRESGDPVNDFKEYRESDAGGNHSVQIANIDDIYNLFGFGDPTTLAIANFIGYANSQNTVNNVFIIGKGFTVNTNYYRGSQTSINIPTYGLPGTDLPYTLGINADPLLPGIPIGRLSATSPQQVTNYLNKVIEMEALPFNDLFRKDFVQLSGGVNENEISAFESIVQGFTRTIDNDFIGGRAFNTGKQTSANVEFIDISGRVNEGVGYITFFGHSSGTVTDIEIGRVSEPEFGFSNKGKYPIFIVNGCQAGEIFGSGLTFGEDWILTSDLGAVGFIAHTNTALASTLENWSTVFYETGFGDDVFIGKSIGEVLIEVSSRYLQQFGSSNLNLTQIRQMQLQGDPAYRLFGADFPDYHVDANSISASAIGAEEILATQDSFKVDIIVRNFGRTVQDSLIVQIDRTYPDGTNELYFGKYLRPLRQDTLEFIITNDLTRNNEGANLLTISLDPQNTVEEENETNNSVTIEVPIFNGNTLNLFPLNNGTQSNEEVEFIWQSSNLFEEERVYELEFDTQSDFSGPNRRSVNVTGELVLEHVFDFSTFSLPDTATVFWRTRFANPAPDESNVWTESSFTLIGDVQTGWGQYDSDQLDRELITGVEFNSSSDEWEFIQTTTPIDIFTFGVDNTVFTQEDVHAIIRGVDLIFTTNPFDGTCENNTLNAIAFDIESGDPYKPIPITLPDVNNREVCGRLPQRVYQFREVDLIGTERRLQVMVDNLGDGDMIALFSMGNLMYSNWDAELITTLNLLGISSATISSLTDGQPVIFLGRKGGAPGTATVVANDGTGTPITEQSIDIQSNVLGSFTSGTIRSERIGPANSWESFSYDIIEEANDSFTIDLFGVTPDGQLNSLVSRTRETIDVSSIDPIQYPQIELVYGFEDATNQTPPQLNFWEVNYTYPPEGVLTVSENGLQNFVEGQEITREFQFINISPNDFTDSLAVMSRLINQDLGTVTETSFLIAPPAAGDTTRFDASYSSFNMGGLNSLILEVQANENESYTINNRIVLPDLIEVEADETNPILDVTFDGFHILDGDVVSPSPMISVRMRDDNPFTVKTDTTGFNIFLRLPGDNSQFERISFTDPRLTFTPASENQDFEVEFQPGPLEDGEYGLMVRAQDEIGNEAGTEPYEINFEVVNESSITHFYPYPNPFSTNCRFVFTLTGSEVPDQIKIQIMTVSGRVVREITQDEIGPIRIGNNITTYAWDGTDEFGDQLANGVYFYKVFTNSNGNEINQRFTSGDKAFKNGFGKLYILR